MTVSRVISNKAAIKPETRRRVRRVIRDLDFEPNHIAQSLTGSRSYTIGVIVRSTRWPDADLPTLLEMFLSALL